MKRDFTPILFGVIISTALAGTLVIAGLKAGITPGVSPRARTCAAKRSASSAVAIIGAITHGALPVRSPAT